jgi:hypothetical protein
MAERQYLYFRMAPQTLRWASPSSLPRQPALAAAECDPQLGLGRPRKHLYSRSTI